MLFDRLRQIEERSHAIARALSDPAIFSQQAEYARLRKEHADSLEVLEKFDEYREVLKRLGEARHILSEGGDRELDNGPRIMRLNARDVVVAAAVSEQRPARPLLAMRRTPRRRLGEPRPVQRQPGHRVAQLVVVPLRQLLVKMLHREVGIASAVELQHPRDL